MEQNERFFFDESFFKIHFPLSSYEIRMLIFLRKKKGKTIYLISQANVLGIFYISKSNRIRQSNLAHQLKGDKRERERERVLIM